MFSAANVPAHANITVWLTGSSVDWDTDPDGVGEHGWVDTSDYRTLEESRNYVSPVSTYSEDCEDGESVKDWMLRILSDELGAYSDNGNGTFYGQDEQHVDYSDSRSITYALHFHAKLSTVNGWEEIAISLD